MISSKEDLIYYLEEDKKQLNIKEKRPPIFGHEVWKFQIALRKFEYYVNLNKKRGAIFYIKKKYWNYQFHRYSIMLGFDIPINVFGPGLNIHHYGCLVVNGNARIGKNCNLQQHVTIGTNDTGLAATIGDNVFIGTGAKIIGNVRIANGCVIGANAVVTKDFLEENTIIVGVPARKLEKK